MKRVVIGLGLTVSVLVLAIVAVVMFATGEQIKPAVEWTMSRAMDKPVTIGALDIDRGGVTTLSLSDLKIGTLEEGGSDPYVQLHNGSITVSFTDLIRLRPRVGALSVAGADMTVVRQTSEIEKEQQTSLGFPQVFADEIDLQDIVYRQTTSGQTEEDASDLSVTIERAKGRYVPGEAVELEGSGRYLEDKFNFIVSADAASTLADSEAFPVSLEVSGPIKASASATLDTSGGLSPVAFSIEGPTVAGLGGFSPVPLPETPPFSLSGTLRIEPQALSVENMSGTIGDSDVSGRVRADLSGSLPFVEGVIQSTLLDFDDLAGLIGSTPDTSETASAEQEEQANTAGPVPDTVLPVTALRSVNFDITFVADKVNSPIAQIESVDAKLVMTDNRLVISPLTLGVSDGLAKGEIALNVREEVPSADIALTYSDVSLVKFFQGGKFAEEMKGTMSGEIYLLGVGYSLADMLKTLRGDGTLFLRDGKVSALLVEAGGLDIAESLGVVLSGDTPIPMPCAGVSVSAKDGLVNIEHAQAFTSDSLIQAVGDMELDTFSYRVTMEAQAWDFSLLDLSAPVSVVGSPDGMNISIGRIEGFPFLKQGVGEPIDCDVLRQNVSGK